MAQETSMKLHNRVMAVPMQRWSNRFRVITQNYGRGRRRAQLTLHVAEREQKRSMKARLKNAWDMVVEFGDITEQRHIFLLASGIAFNQLICIIPLSLFVISIVSGIVPVHDVKAAIENVVQLVLPQGIEAQRAVASVIYDLGAVFTYKSLAGIIALIALLWLSSALFSSLRTGLNAIFHVPTPRFFVWYKLKDLLLTVITAVLVLLTTTLSPMLTAAEEFGRTVMGPNVSPPLFGLGVQTISVISTTVLFYVLYRWVPNRRLPWQIVVMSTLFAVLGWEVARWGFAYYVNTATNLSKFYGGYIVLASLALWFYYSAFVFLISAELAQYIHVRRTEHRAPEA
jgi:membrane protein